MSLEVGRFEQQIAPLLAELHASANAHDTDRHLAVLWRDPALIFIINGEVIRGWDALREQQLKWWDHGRAVGVYESLGEPIYDAFGEDSGMTTHVMAARAPLAHGRVRERQLAYTALWRRHPEGWRIIYAHESGTR
jgi:ketosteroid isomerase-like protein